MKHLYMEIFCIGMKQSAARIWFDPTLLGLPTDSLEIKLIPNRKVVLVKIESIL